MNDAAAAAWGGLGLYAPEQNTLNDGEWHHLVYAFDRTGYAAVYRDGVLDNERFIAAGSEWNLDTGMPFDIGQAGTLLECDTVKGTYTPVEGTSPSYYHVTPSAAGKFYRIRL